jgi:hypothetical protein
MPRTGGLSFSFHATVHYYPVAMAEYKFTEYFEKEVLRKRPYLKKE